MAYKACLTTQKQWDTGYLANRLGIFWTKARGKILKVIKPRPPSYSRLSVWVSWAGKGEGPSSLQSLLLLQNQLKINAPKGSFGAAELGPPSLPWCGVLLFRSTVYAFLCAYVPKNGVVFVFFKCIQITPFCMWDSSDFSFSTVWRVIHSNTDRAVPFIFGSHTGVGKSRFTIVSMGNSLLYYY